jgi:hypothetical protein
MSRKKRVRKSKVRAEPALPQAQQTPKLVNDAHATLPLSSSPESAGRHLNAKEVVLTLIATALAFASLRENDPTIVYPMLLVSWGGFLWLCWAHVETRYRRALGAILITSVLAWIGLRLSGARADAPSARLSIDKVDILQKPKNAHLSIFNIGQIPAEGWISNTLIRVAHDPLKPAEIAALQKSVGRRINYTAAVAHFGNAKSQVDPGTGGFFSEPHNLAMFNADLLTKYHDDVIAGKKRLYLFVTLKYRDAMLPDKHLRVTDFCGYFIDSFTFWHNCGQNRTYQESY